MPKDNDNITFPNLLDDGPLTSGPKPFAPDQMIRCEECLRANGPTRVNCLYCGAALPTTETSVNLQKPALRPLEKWEQGYNNILLPRSAKSVTETGAPPDSIKPDPGEEQLAEAADLLKISVEGLVRILSTGLAMPLARAASLDEAILVERRLSRLGIDNLVLPDAELGNVESGPVRIRSIDVGTDSLHLYQMPETPSIEVPWLDLELVVIGRLIVKRVEVREQKAGRDENRILDANEFFTDEAVLEFYAKGTPAPYRITANGFDFSCLGEAKGLVAGENLVTLLNLFRTRAPQIQVDDSYKSARKALDVVWPPQQANEAVGWRRDRPGKYTIGSATEMSNEMQFHRYSRLRSYLLANPQGQQS